MIQHGTDWNRHRGVGATLLENWVEERAVGDLIIDERSDIPLLSRQGHSNLLVHSNQDTTLETTQRDDFSVKSRLGRSKRVIGKRRELLEAELMKKAIKEMEEPEIDRSTSDWVSTTYSDFSRSDVYKPFKGLGQQAPPKEQSEKYSRAITFWTDFAVKGSGTAICSTDAAELQQLGGNAPQPSVVGLRACQLYQKNASAAAVRFGKHAAFTTPIKESLVAPEVQLKSEIA